VREIEFNTATSLIVLISRFRLHDLVNLNFSMFWEVLLELRKFWQPYDNFDDKNGNFH
jgi:hypothetical protein